MSEEKVHSILYRTLVDEQMFGLYVPREVFDFGPWPEFLYLRLGLP